MSFIATQQGPHRRDWQRFIRAANALGRETDYGIATTGTVYVRVANRDADGDPDWDDARTYRFASHAECYDSHDYSVVSGSAAPRPRTSLPPGYDGWINDAILDLAKWCGFPDHAVARRARAANRRRDAKIESQQRERAALIAEREARAAASVAAYELLDRAVRRLAERLWPRWPELWSTRDQAADNVRYRVIETFGLPVTVRELKYRRAICKGT